MNVFYEKEEFSNNHVPIRFYFHNYTDSHMFTVIHWHRSLEINLTLAGEITHNIDGQTVTCGPGQMCIVNSGEIHSNHSSCEQPEIRVITLQIAMSFIQEWFGENIHFCLPESYTEQEEIRSTLMKMAQVNNNPNQFRELRQMELLFRLMVLLSKTCKEQSAQKQAQKDGIERFKEVLDYIEQHYREELSLDSLAQQFGYSPTYLSRSFKKHIGYNFSAHVQMIRLNAAAADMRVHPEKTILECSEEHGFPNVKSFIHVFRQEYGITPSEWRKKHGDRQETTVAVYVDAIPLEYVGMDEMYQTMRKE